MPNDTSSQNVDRFSGKFCSGVLRVWRRLPILYQFQFFPQRHKEHKEY